MKVTSEQAVIPKFSFKSSLLLLIAAFMGGVLIPYMFYEIGWNPKYGAFLFLPLLISFALAYGQCFIETKAGLCKRFFRNLLFSFTILEIAAYFWLFKGLIF